MVFVYQVNGPVEILFDVGRGQRGIAALRPSVSARRMVLRVVVLRIESLPPKPLAVGLGHLPIVRHAGQRARSAHRLGPTADDVLLRPTGHAVPWLVLRIIQVEVVMVDGHGREILRSGPLVERDEVFRIPVLGLPFVDHILETKL